MQDNYEQRNLPFFSFPNPINESVARSVAAGVVIMSAATIFLTNRG